MPLLSVKLDMIAAMREAGRSGEPDPSQTAVLAELGGADGLAIQLRRDRKYIRDRDLYLLKGISKTKLTVLMPPTDENIDRVLEVKPWLVMLAADHADSQTPFSPIDFGTAAVDFRDLSGRLTGVGINVGFFVDADGDQIKSAAKNEASAVLLNCAGYTSARSMSEAQAELDRIDKAVQAGVKAGVEVHCGNGITYKNVLPLIELGQIDEFCIGQAICARAVMTGMERSVREMVELLRLPTHS